MRRFRNFKFLIFPVFISMAAFVCIRMLIVEDYLSLCVVFVFFLFAIYGIFSIEDFKEAKKKREEVDDNIY